MEDPFDLERFVSAQDHDGAYERALVELRAGRKRSHWIWFVLPQLAGLGRSDLARRYGISGLEEARAYAAHPVLGPRLQACARVLLEVDAIDPVAIMGLVDAIKLRSSMTLFATAAPHETDYAAVLARMYPEGPDPATAGLLEGELSD